MSDFFVTETDTPRILPGVSLTGSMYDVFGDDATNDSAIFQIFDWSKAEWGTTEINGTEYRIPKLMNAEGVAGSEYVSIYGNTVEEYQQSLAASVAVSGSNMFFSGSLETQFGSSSMRRSENAFSRVEQVVKLWSIGLPPSKKLRELLSGSFLEALDGLPAAASTSEEQAEYKGFLDTWGAFYLSGMLIGGKTLFTSSVNKLTVDRTLSISVTADLSYKSVTGQISNEDKIKYASQLSQFASSSNTVKNAFGGNPALASRVFDGRVQYDEWSASVAQNPVIVRFDGTRPLTGVWTLCSTPERGKILESYFDDKWAPARSLELSHFPDVVDDLTVVVGNDDQPHVPDGYTKDDYDLNRHAGGKFIYLCWHKVPVSGLRKPKRVLQAMQVIYNGDKVPDGYSKINVDLNQGAGGDDVFLCMKQGEYGTDENILDVRVIGGNDSFVPAPYGYKTLPGDLNKGAGGDYVYIAYAN
ncbi:hypothetical protein C5C03_11700 [Clavibacter michiganensis]|uniref:MAC/perforin domain-containing protein n=1 Tax=Clavibacter michiganensis TaxID=28447 RepID=UPI000CE7DE03|nr:MAC/perforin domain-containing protein [Clavibacter michiganensis]PPF86766.1 hypothetical protein C5C03_11700 [Clavibacter michiganensis]PPF93491.1 hypothetical protein C5C05_11695 [Clavibacter michiganensis]